MPPVLRVLGVPELLPGDPACPDPPKLGGAKQRGVLARLALATPARVTVDQLVVLDQHLRSRSIAPPGHRGQRG